MGQKDQDQSSGGTDRSGGPPRETGGAEKMADYAVGYRRPPKATQFFPGKSGNAKGRPRGRRSVGATFNEILQQKIAVTENGRTRRVPLIEAVLRKLARDALKTDSKTLKILLALADRYSETPEGGRQTEDLLAEDLEILQQYLSPLKTDAPAANGTAPISPEEGDAD
jgi:Family of unknown function (DUF5681)